MFYHIMHHDKAQDQLTEEKEKTALKCQAQNGPIQMNEIPVITIK